MTQTVIPATATFPGYVSNEGHNDHNDHNDQWPGARHYDAARHLGEVFNGVSVAVEKVGAANSLAIEKTAGALGVAIQATAAATNLAIEKTAAATNLALQVAASAAQLLAAQNAAAQLAATEKCCCEMKELVRQLDHDRMVHELTDAKLTIALNNRRTVIPGI